ncbi:MAG TPA: CDP-glucose 4,6-dehydratase [Acetobacteraceae bacterium]|nr:CDP-glucose 4,6-dehydratase [Acetobacteraceae bacterium]
MQALLNPRRDFWRGRRVLVVGHTGFKGGWLSLWLHRMGASVTGLSLPPPTEPSLFALAGLDALIETQIGDIRDFPTVVAALARWRPEVVFHLAAQALVRRSYREPIETFATNVMGTVHVLEAIRATPSVRCTIVVTSDKCYENREWPWAYREIDPVGGDEPYSASKGCAELVAASYRHAFFPAIATARAGNVVGGGDWAEDRLLPDCIRALTANEAIAIRNPHAVRPWQHVLEPLCGYLILAERLAENPARFGDAWNFGPPGDHARPVGWVASKVVEHWRERATWDVVSGDGPHEAEALIVDASKARARLGWQPRLTLPEALRWTVEWYRRQAAGEPALALTDSQIAEYIAMSGA